MTEPPAFSFAFQPIVNVTSGMTVGFEALVRGPNNESAYSVLQQLGAGDMLQFDQLLRERAISTAARLGIGCKLSLNFMPQGLEVSGESIDSTLEAAAQHNIAPHRLTLEIIETQIIGDLAKFAKNLGRYRGTGLNFAIDDFGCGYSGLNLLAEFQPDSLKLDMSLIRDIHTRGPRQAIVRGISRCCTDLGIDIVAEGVETLAEYMWCRDEGIELFQGYLFAKPGFEQLPSAYYPQVV